MASESEVCAWFTFKPLWHPDVKCEPSVALSGTLYLLTATPESKLKASPAGWFLC